MDKEEADDLPAVEEGMTLTQAHHWWEHGHMKLGAPQQGDDASPATQEINTAKEAEADNYARATTDTPDYISWTQAHDLIYGEGGLEDQEGVDDPGLAATSADPARNDEDWQVPDLHSIRARLRRVADGTGQETLAPNVQAQSGGGALPNKPPEHEHFIRGVMFYGPEEQQDFVLGTGEGSPRKQCTIDRGG